MKEKTLIILKPDCLEQKVAGNVISRFEAAGFEIKACKMLQMTDALLREHYSHLIEKPFFGFLSDFMKKTPVIALALEGENVVAEVRKLLGPTNSAVAPAGTIRGDFGDKNVVTFNICHASDSAENGEIEIARFFKKDEIF